MSASVMMGHYSPETSRDMSPREDDMSALFPDRPIRPLPKRKLRERLSPDVAGSIKYPPAPPTTTPLFYYPYNLNGEEDRPRGEQYQLDRQRAEDLERNYIPKNKGEELDSDDELPEVGPNRGRHVRHSPEPKGTAVRYFQQSNKPAKYSGSEPPASVASSVDGYDSFENTNNKKKRKIPTPGDAGLNGIHLSNELAALGISQETEDVARDVELNTQQHGSPGQTAHSGLSGPGRGRYAARVRNGRSPMRTLTDANSRNPKQRQQWPNDESSGIISTAIANAEKLPMTPTRGQENVSLLQQASQKASPASAQFTFTCDSQVPGTVLWPGPPSKDNMNPNMAARNGMNTRATQTSPNVPSTVQPHTANQPNKPLVDGKQAAPKKTRRRTGKEYLIAARQRREQQEYQNYHHPPSPEDLWICEFCEYERIFGTPPEALIKQYELKDRRVRKQEAERRRLLEKAKMKGRKGKKGNKGAHKNQAVNQHNAPPPPAGFDGTHSQGTQSEDYYEEEFDDEYAHDEQPLSTSADKSVSVARKIEGEMANSKNRLAYPEGVGSSEQGVS